MEKFQGKKKPYGESRGGDSFNREDSRGFRNEHGGGRSEDGGAGAFMKDRRPKSFNESGGGYDNRPKYGRDDRGDKPHKPFRRDGDAPRREDNGERRSFNPNFTKDNKLVGREDTPRYGRDGGHSSYRKDDSRPFRKDDGYSFNRDNRSFNRDDNRSFHGDNDRKPYRRDDNGGERYGDKREGGYSKPNYEKREGYSKPSFGERKEGGYSKSGASYPKRDGYSKPSYGDKREGGYSKPSFGDRKEGGYSKPSYGDRREGGFNSARGERREGGYSKPSFGERREGGYSKPGASYKRDGYSKPSYGSDRGGFNSERDRGDKPQPDYAKPTLGDKHGAFPKPSYGAAGRPTYRRDGSGQQSKDYPRFNAPKQDGLMRLNRFVAMSGVCSRREADEFIEAGLVTVNGQIVTELGTKIEPTDEVRFNDELLKGEKKVYILMNKPKGYVTTLEDPHADKTVIDLIQGGCEERVYPVGRLDKNSLGVLLITNDGDLTRKLTHPSNNKKKVYQVSLDKPLTKTDMQSILDGLTLEDGEIAADDISYVKDNKKEIGIEIHSGRNRIVRRIFESLGYTVTKLDRVYFAGLTKKSLKRGAWRFLTPIEVSRLQSGEYE